MTRLVMIESMLILCQPASILDIRQSSRRLQMNSGISTGISGFLDWDIENNPLELF
jgi:hypothetical protein